MKNRLATVPAAVEYDDTFRAAPDSAAPRGPLSIYLFGDLRIARGDGSTITLNSQREQSLLAYLVLRAGLPQPRRHISFLLWPDSTEEQARSNLRKLLHDLRRALPEVDRYLEAAGPHLVWRTDVPFSLDVATFERHITQATAIADLQQAVDLYRGPLFPACYDDWILPERERLHQVWVDALERLMEQLENRGDYRSAIQYGQMLLQQDALHEEVYRHLMRLHALVDDRAAALRTYQTCAAVLKRELAVEPSPATQQLYERLTKLPTTPNPSKTPSVMSTAQGHSTATALPLVGHRNEWQRLQEAWRAVGKGRPHWVALSGAAGIGKTRLADELLSWAAKQGIATANARAYRAESGLGYGALTSWLRARPLPPLDSVWLAELVRLLPELAVQHPELPAPGPLSEPWQRLRFFEAVARALLASQPLILLLDDIQYADADTLEWLHYAVRSNPQAALLIVSTLCWEEVSREHPLRPLFQSLRRNGQLNEIGVQPLNAEETTDLAQQVVGAELTPTERTALYRETEGNALYIVEVMRAGRQSIASPKLPRSVQGVMAGRLEQLDVETWGLAKVAAVIGRQFTVGLLSAASGVSESVLAHGLGELRDKRIVKAPQGERYDFDHSALREVLYAALNPAEKQTLHRKTADALIALHGPNPNGMSGEIVMHFQQAGLPKRAVPYAIHAGDVARERYANETAIEHYRAALPHIEGTERAEILLRLGKVLELVGKWNDAESSYRASLALAEKLDAVRATAQAQMALGEILHRHGQDREALVWLDCARRGFEQQNDLGSAARVFQDLGIIKDLQGDDAHALAYHQQKLAIAMKLDDQRGVSQALGNIGWVYWRQGDYARALALYAQQFEIAQTLNDAREMARALTHQGMALFEQDNYTAAETAHIRALELLTQVGDRVAIAFVVGHLGELDSARGNYVRALERYTQQLDTMRACSAPRGIAHVARNMGIVYREVGRYAEAQACFDASLQLGLEMDDRRIVSYALLHAAIAAREQGQYARARQMFERAGRLFDEMNMPYHLSEQQYHYARMNDAEGCFAEAEQLCSAARETAREIGRQDMLFESALLSSRLQFVRGRLSWDELQEQSKKLLTQAPNDAGQAAVYYEMAQLNVQTQWGKKAARLYRELYARVPKNEYRRRIEELTRQRVPENVSLPPAPEWAEGRVDTTILLAHVDQMLTGELA